MGDMLRQGLELKQTQKLSPLQIQTIKLIELPVQELEQRIRKELEENPVLDEDAAKEREDDEEPENEPREVSLSDYKEDDSIPSYKLHVNNYGKDERLMAQGIFISTLLSIFSIPPPEVKRHISPIFFPPSTTRRYGCPFANCKVGTLISTSSKLLGYAPFAK